MTPEQEKARDNIIRLYDRMIECEWLTGHALKEGRELIQFTPDGLNCTKMIAALFGGVPIEGDQGLYMAFFGFVEKVVKNTPEA